MTAAALVEQPDLEALVWARIGHLKGVTSFAYTATTAWPSWVWAHFIQVDARHKDKQAARDLAERVRRIIYALAGQPWPAGVICYVEAVEGPFWLPDDDGAPRYCARYEIRVHPPRAATVRADP